MNTYKILQRKHIELHRWIEVQAEDIHDAQKDLPTDGEFPILAFTDYSIQEMKLINGKEPPKPGKKKI